MAKKKPASVPVDAHKHVADKRPNLPTRETDDTRLHKTKPEIRKLLYGGAA